VRTLAQLACLTSLLILGCGPKTPGIGPLPPDLRTRQDGSDWPAFLGPLGTSVSTEKGLITPWPRQGPRIVWHTTIAEGYAAPTISRGRLFLFDRLRNRARLRCLESETGKPLWTFEYHTDYRDFYNYDGGPRCCPVVDDDRVYLYGPEGMLHCVDVADGKEIWKVDTKEEFGVIQNFFGVGSTPVVEKDLLLVQVGGSPPGSDQVFFGNLKGNGTGLVAFDKLTGKVKYKTSNELASYSSPVLRTIEGKRWCFLFARGGLLGLDPATGKQRFRFPWRARILESVNASNPVVVGKRIFLSECYGPGSVLLELNDKGVKEVWSDQERGRDKSMRCHWMTPIHVDGYLYGCSGRHTNEADLRCIELATGKVMWRQPDMNRCSLLQVDGHFICLGEHGVLRLLKINPKKYEEISKVDLTLAGEEKEDPQASALLHYPCWAAPVLSHGLLYVRGQGRLVCLEVIPQKHK
jgi:outer membrane protein assembly factor BamB